jgi:hypothetical protein
VLRYRVMERRRICRRDVGICGAVHVGRGWIGGKMRTLGGSSGCIQKSSSGIDIQKCQVS